MNSTRLQPREAGPIQMVARLLSEFVAVILILAIAVLYHVHRATVPVISLTQAAETGNLSAVRNAIANGASLRQKDEIGRTPLYIAANAGNVAMVKLLLDEGAPIDLGSDTLGTPLFASAASNHADVMRILLRHGADPLIRCPAHHCDSLEQAVRSLGPDCVGLLLAAGVDPNSVDDDGETALITAADYDEVECAKLLIDAHTRIDPVDAQHRSARSIAMEHGNRQMLELLDGVH